MLFSNHSALALKNLTALYGFLISYHVLGDIHFRHKNAGTLMYACHIEFNNPNVFIGVERTRRISQHHNGEKDTLRFNYDFSVLFTEAMEAQLLKG